MNKTTVQFLFLGSLALFLTSCDSSKTDSKDKTADKTSKKEDEMIIGVGTSDDPNATIPDDYYEEIAFFKSLEKPVEPDTPDSAEEDASEKEVFHGVVFKAHLNDYFSSKELSAVNKLKEKTKDLLNSPTFYLNTENYKLCGLTAQNYNDAYQFSQDLSEKIEEADCDNLKTDISLPQSNLARINYLDNTERYGLDSNSLFLNQDNLLSQQVFKDMTTPYFHYRFSIDLKPFQGKPQTHLGYADLMVIGQKLIAKYIDQKFGDEPLIPYKEVRDTYKKMFSFNPQQVTFTNKKQKIVKGNLLALLKDKEKILHYELFTHLPESNLYLSAYSTGKDSYHFDFSLCGAQNINLQLNYYKNELSAYFDVYEVNPHNLLFKETQSNKPLEEGGVIPEKLFGQMHAYLGYTCH